MTTGTGLQYVPHLHGESSRGFLTDECCLFLPT